MAEALQSLDTADEPALPRVLPSFDEVYSAYFDFVWLSLRRLGVATEALDDAAQDVFVVVYRKLPEFELRCSVKTWLFSLALRVAHAERRKRAPIARDYELEQLVDATCSPQEALARREALRLMDRILSNMDDERRAVFIMAELEQLPMPEIAEALGLKLNTAYSRLRLAREQFSAEVKRHGARDAWRQP